MSPQTARRVTIDVSDRKWFALGTLTIIMAALLSSAGTVSGGAWIVTSSMIRTIARITLFYLGNARG